MCLRYHQLKSSLIPEGQVSWVWILDVTFTLWISKQWIGEHVWLDRLFPVYVHLTKQLGAENQTILGSSMCTPWQRCIDPGGSGLVTKSWSALCDPMDYSPTGSFAHGILQARIPKWVAISFSKELPHPGIEPASLVSPALAGRFFTIEPQILSFHTRIIWCPLRYP